MQKLDIFVERLKKNGIRLELTSNFPWIYLNKINDKLVKEKFRAEHGFTIAFHPIRIGQELQFTDLKEIFKIIRKYTNKPNKRCYCGNIIDKSNSDGIDFSLCNKHLQDS
jgi:hypothetical protein